MLDHFEIAYLEKSLPDTSALPQPDTPLYFCMSYKGMSEMHVVLSEPNMLCQDYHFPVQCRSILIPRNNSDFVQCNIRNKTEKKYNERKEMKRMAGSTVEYNCTRRESPLLESVGFIHSMWLIIPFSIAARQL